MCKYLGWRLTHDDDEAWVEILRYLGNKREMDAIHRRVKIQFEEDEKRRICQTVFENCMKSLPLEDNKVSLAADGSKDRMECQPNIEFLPGILGVKLNRGACLRGTKELVAKL